MRSSGSDEQELNNGKWRRSAVLLSTSSSIALLFTHPIDLVRIQMLSQLAYVSPGQVLRKLFKYRGFRGIYYGLLAAMQREFIYCICRFSFYERARSRGLVDNLWRKMQYAAVSGFFAGLILTPITKVSVRIRTDAVKPPSSRYDYANVFHGLWELHKEGGFKHLYSMSLTCAIRGMLITVCQLSIYDQINEAILKHNIKLGRHWEVYFLSSAIAGSLTVIALTPIDLIENIGHNTPPNKHAFKMNEWNIVKSLSRTYGWRGFFRGFTTNCLRSSPQTILTFLIYEQIFSKNFGVES